MRSQAYNLVPSGFARPMHLVEDCWHRALELTARARFQMLEWHRRVRVRAELATLTDSDLHDIRWTRAEVEAETRKPFWRA